MRGRSWPVRRIAVLAFTMSVVWGLDLGTAVAQDPEPAASAPTMCASAQYRQFDFWVGEWDVHGPDGRFQGSNTIRSIQGGCALQEFWSGAGGGTGTSLNTYDFTTGKWHQTWVSGSMLLLLDGGFHDGAMIMEGTTVGQNGRVLHNRITWTPIARDTVTQVWDTSPDGVTWTTVFNGRYTRR